MRENSLKGTNSSNRNYWRWHGVTQQLPSTNGSLALKDPPKRPEQPPIKVGTRIRVLATLFQDGVKRLVEGVITIMSAQSHAMVGWLYRVEFNGIIQFFQWKIEDIIEAWRSWWAQPRHKQCEAGRSLPTQPASLALLPAPQQQIAGLLPAVCA